MSKVYLCTLFLVLSFAHSEGQLLSIDSLKKKLEVYQQRNLQEKLFLHIDHNAYLAGETIRFKIYCVDARAHREFDLSSVAYVEIVNRKGNAIATEKVSLKNGHGDGFITIPIDTDSDNYKVRTYTAWMRNFSTDFYFNQSITIVNSFKSASKRGDTAKPEIDAQFFPEGGRMVVGIKSKVAFRIVNESGNGIDVTGGIINEHADTVARFVTSKFGLGHVDITPTSQTAYRAFIVDRKGNHFQVGLPAAADRGYVISASRNASSFKVSVYANAGEAVTLVGHTRGKLFYAQQLPLIEGRTVFTFDNRMAGVGISHLTLFDDQGRPVAERLIYNKPEALPELTATTDQKEYPQRTKVNLTIQQKNLVEIGEHGHFSLSVHQVDSLSIFEKPDIASYLLLISDLTGNIESPQFYLDSANNEQFDNLMLTHGWRRFAWTDVLKNNAQTLQYLPELNGPILAGRLLDAGNRPLQNTPTFLSKGAGSIDLNTYVSDKDGNVNLVLSDIVWDTKLYLQNDPKVQQSVQFVMNGTKAMTDASHWLPQLSISKNLANTILSRSVAMQAQLIYQSKTDLNQAPAQDSVVFYGKPDEQYYLDDYTRFPVMEEVMREFVKGVWVRKRQEKFHFIVLDNVNKSVFKNDPLILLDGVPVFDVNKVMNIDPTKVKRIDVVTKEFYLGGVSFPGIVAYLTYKNDLADVAIDGVTTIIDYKGLQATREFFVPKYETEAQRTSRLPDQRTLLHWAPSIRMIDGKAQVEFYTSDLLGTFEIHLQGLLDNGTPISAKTTFAVSNINN